MNYYVIQRFLLFIPTLFVASLIIFVTMRVLPGDVVSVVLGGSGQTTVNPQDLEALRTEMGLKDPLIIQYLEWIGSMLIGEFGGLSLETKEPIRQLLARQISVTVSLSIYAIILGSLLSIPIGILAAINHNGWIDYATRFFSITGNAMPSFWVSLMVLLGAVVVFNWSPPVIYKSFINHPIHHVQLMIIPALALGWQFGSHLTRSTRSATLDVLRQDFIRTARAKGLRSKQIMNPHILRNILIPVLTVGSIQISGIIGGTIVLESIFGLPGLGRGLVTAVIARDYPVVQAISMIFLSMILFINLALDLLYVAVDRRISYRNYKIQNG
jgi:peptide/nickel transport system permease protein